MIEVSRRLNLAVRDDDIVVECNDSRIVCAAGSNSGVRDDDVAGGRCHTAVATVACGRSGNRAIRD